MNENENLVLDEGTENVEATATEETVEQVETVETEPEKVYTEEEFNTKFNEAHGKRDARTKAKVRKEYERKYGGLMDVLKAGTGIEDVEELTNTFKEHYSKKGVQFAEKPSYTDVDAQVLARADADELIKLGFEEVVEEADRLNELGAAKMNPREKALFVALTDHINKTESIRELEKIGVGKEVYESQEFKDFAKQFTSDTPITKIHEIFTKTQPKKEIKPMGSIKNTQVDTNELKDFYTPEEAKRFTVKDLDENPRLIGILEASMKRWKNNAS